MQFLPSSYLKYAVDFDGSGHREIRHFSNGGRARVHRQLSLRLPARQRGQPWGEGTANFDVLLQWNASKVYTKTVAYFAEQLAATQ